ncbi:tRNA (adenosine(37)-N6)-dimethylallyltransferase MiaA [Microvirga sp. STR05]|uniref:tRNA dimethylallyltransferase n=1 Tax=Hymenobacter duratus TaxID=2771356 RepID=A0ABR8JHD1_9BACT|nr:tRNA (adenosine(37)-N6)-dimethylallyltransferase MiaA [Hymenobacter duratus]MBD2716254.1 tRNA (adenosine(37)-N6)-dimethylallyltransferase MiaA [Hymenobacter duratus]MBR7951170.1 tRNA (adenosine(37)-N6)-dimethylallyltransferase MiaA [Microvirga sp. STR05]
MSILSELIAALEPDLRSEQPTLLVVAGPTAVGKTALSVQLAQHFQTEIVSADSRQFFREMSIGTAKPTPEEMQGVSHHFVNSHTISEDYSAGRFETDCLQVLDGLFQRHPVVILTGGSGLYLQAVTDGLDELPPADPAIRVQLQQELAEFGLEHLAAELSRLDPVAYARIDKQNHQRVVRAVEVCRATGQPFSSFHTGRSAVARPFRVVKVALSREREELYERINYRVDQMLEAGLLAEVEALLPYRHHNALQTVGYQEIFGFLDGLYDWPEAVRLLKRNTRHYAKRQLTWLRRDSAYRWIDLG